MDLTQSSILPSAQQSTSLSQVETQDQTQQTQSSGAGRNFYSADEDLDLNGSEEDDEAYYIIRASGLEETQPTDIYGQETLMYEREQKAYESYQREH